MLGLEATTMRRRASGSGRITLPGNLHLGHLKNQTIWVEIRTVCTVTVAIIGLDVNGLIVNAS